MMEELCDEKTSLERKVELIQSAKISAEMLTTCAEYILNHAVPLKIENALDICGTGGDNGRGIKTFNISTAAAFILSAAGIKIAKHGNRAVSSQSGSSDVLGVLGIPVCSTAYEAEKCFTWNNLAFISAPAFHPTLKNVADARKKIGKATFFNLLGPLCNPARVKKQVIGIFDSFFSPMLAEAAKNLGKENVMVVHGDGIDEISVSGETEIVHLRNDEIFRESFAPKNFQDREQLRGGTPEENAAIIRKILEGEKGARADIVCLNAAAGFVVEGLDETLEEGFERARGVLESGAARKKFLEMKAWTLS